MCVDVLSDAKPQLLLLLLLLLQREGTCHPWFYFPKDSGVGWELL